MSLLRKPDTPTKPGTILRARGLVITDAQGRDRILIGAPVPASKDRTRKDDASDGIIFLGETGADRLAVGQLPTQHIDGKTYKRRGDDDNYGMTLYDTKGSERGGLASMGGGRVGLALDRATPPYEAIGLMIDDAENFAGMYINYGDPEARDSVATAAGKRVSAACGARNSRARNQRSHGSDSQRSTAVPSSQHSGSASRYHRKPQRGSPPAHRYRRTTANTTNMWLRYIS